MEFAAEKSAAAGEAGGEFELCNLFSVRWLREEAELQFYFWPSIKDETGRL